MANRSRKTRESVWLAQNKKCYWCGRDIEFHVHKNGAPPPGNAVTVDHVFPIWHPKRKKHKLEGIPSPFVISCVRCNNLRGYQDFKEFSVVALKKFGSHTLNAKRMGFQPSAAGVTVLRNTNRPIKYKGFKK
jgi:hypothetical protein